MTIVFGRSSDSLIAKVLCPNVFFTIWFFFFLLVLVLNEESEVEIVWMILKE